MGSIGLSSDFMGALAGQSSNSSSLDELPRCLDRQEFALVAVGRPLLADEYHPYDYREHDCRPWAARCWPTPTG